MRTLDLIARRVKRPERPCATPGCARLATARRDICRRCAERQSIQRHRAAHPLPPLICRQCQGEIPRQPDLPPRRYCLACTEQRRSSPAPPEPLTCPDCGLEHGQHATYCEACKLPVGPGHLMPDVRLWPGDGKRCCRACLRARVIRLYAAQRKPVPDHVWAAILPEPLSDEALAAWARAMEGVTR